MNKRQFKYRVLYICHTPTHCGGAALSLLNLIHSIADAVCPIVVFPDKGIVYDLFKSKGIECKVVPFDFTSLPELHSKSFVSLLRRFVRKLIIMNHNRHAVSMLCKIVDDYNIQIVHSNSGVFTIGASLARRKGIKHVWHLREFQDLDFGLKPMMGMKRFRSKVAKADAVISITDAVSRHFGMKDKSNGHVLWDAVKSLNEVEQVSAKKKGKYFFFCSAILCESKGVSFAIEAFAKSGLALKGYELVLAGETIDDVLMSKLHRDLARFDIEKSVDFIGYQSDTVPYFKEAAGFLMCSESEGLGRVTVEAMFYGCPVIARRSGGTSEIVTDGDNGFLFDNVEECASLLRKVVSEDMSGVIQRAWDFAIEHFTEEKYGNSIKKIYNEIL